MLAAAVAIGATAIVTTNVRDFAVPDVAGIRVAPQTPDGFLTALLDRSTVDAAMTALREHARFHSWTVAEMLALLATATPDRPAIAPNYVQRIAELTGGA